MAFNIRASVNDLTSIVLFQNRKTAPAARGEEEEEPCYQSLCLSCGFSFMIGYDDVSQISHPSVNHEYRIICKAMYQT